MSLEGRILSATRYCRRLRSLNSNYPCCLSPLAFWRVFRSTHSKAKKYGHLAAVWNYNSVGIVTVRRHTCSVTNLNYFPSDCAELVVPYWPRQQINWKKWLNPHRIQLFSGPGLDLGRIWLSPVIWQSLSTQFKISSLSLYKSHEFGHWWRTLGKESLVVINL